MLKRIILFLATNLAVMVLLGLVLTVLERQFGVQLGQTGRLLVIALIFGFGGAFISLAISKWMAKRTMSIRVIDQPRNEGEQWLVDVVRRQAQTAGIKMPEVGIFDAPEINAFATGPTRNNSLVAVSTGLLRAMNRDEAEAVLGHEVSHVANGDMVTMALIQGVLNTFVIFLARVVGRIADAAISGNRDGGVGPFYFIIVMVLDIVFGILASIVAMWFSRWREFRADAGGASLAGKDKMIAALQRLAQTYGQSTLPTEVRAFGISGAARKLPSTKSMPMPNSTLIVDASETNSATVSFPAACALATISRTCFCTSAFLARSWMKLRSIFRIAGSKCVSIWNEFSPVPNCSSATRQPTVATACWNDCSDRRCVNTFDSGICSTSRSPGMP